MIKIVDKFNDSFIVECTCGIEFTVPVGAGKLTKKSRCAMCTQSLKRKPRGTKTKSDEHIQVLFDAFTGLHEKIEMEKHED